MRGLDMGPRPPPETGHAQIFTGKTSLRLKNADGTRQRGLVSRGLNQLKNTFIIEGPKRGETELIRDSP